MTWIQLLTKEYKMVEFNDANEIPKREKSPYPLIDPLEEILQKLETLNYHLEVIKEYLADMTRRE